MHVKVVFSDDVAEHLELTRLSQYYFDGMVKSAASKLFSKSDIQQFSPPPGKFMVHKIIMGASESYGFNRNGDAYPRECLIRDHPTFEKLGVNFREHDHFDRAKSIGTIKSARFDPETDRVETICWLDIDKCPAEYEMAKQGKELSWSQACKVPYDVCSICGHRAPRPALYCDDLKHGMSTYFPGHKKYAFAINPKAVFFDESVVALGADRIARYLEYRFPDDEFRKAASVTPGVISGSEWGRVLGLEAAAKPLVGPYRDILDRLVEIEREFPHEIKRGSARHIALVRAFMNGADFNPAPLRALQPGTAFRKMASRAVMMPLDVFAKYLDDRESSIGIAAKSLPGLFGALSSGGLKVACCLDDVETFEASGPYGAAVDPCVTHEIDNLMEEAHDKFSCQPSGLADRSITVIFVKSAAVDPAGILMAHETPEVITPLAQLYGAYKIASIRDIAELNPDLDREFLLECAVAQNLGFFLDGQKENQHLT